MIFTIIFQSNTVVAQTLNRLRIYYIIVIIIEKQNYGNPEGLLLFKEHKLHHVQKETNIYDRKASWSTASNCLLIPALLPAKFLFIFVKCTSSVFCLSLFLSLTPCKTSYTPFRKFLLHLLYLLNPLIFSYIVSLQETLYPFIFYNLSLTKTLS